VYTYDNQHFYNGGCDAFSSNSFMWFTVDEGKTWDSFQWSNVHKEPIEMKAGESIKLKTEVKFGTDNLQPSDFSIAVWSSVSKVSLTLDREHDNEVHAFPNYELKQDLYNLSGDKIDGTTDDTTTDDTKDDTTDETKDDTTDETTTDETTDDTTTDVVPDEFVVEFPYMFSNSNDNLTHQFQFAEGLNYVNSTTNVVTENEF